MSDLMAKFLAKAEAQKAERAKKMPTEIDALELIAEAHHRLKDLGFDDIVYCPKEGEFDAVIPGFNKVATCMYVGEWPTGGWFVAEGGDWWPARPSLYRKSQ